MMNKLNFSYTRYNTKFELLNLTIPTVSDKIKYYTKTVIHSEPLKNVAVYF